MTSDLSLAGRRVVITGAGRGLGRALAIKTADLGADPVLLGRDASALHAVADAIRFRIGRDAMIVPCDLALPETIKEACRVVLDATPAIDVLINNGAPWLPGDISEVTEIDIVATVAAAVTGTILVTKGLLPGLQRSQAADVVTIVSTAGWPGWDFGAASAAFHAAKHGQSGFSDALRRELRDDGIRVTAIYPPDFEDLDPLDPRWNDPSDRLAANKLTNREVAETVLFALTAPRTCAYPVIIVDKMPTRTARD